MYIRKKLYDNIVSLDDETYYEYVADSYDENSEYEVPEENPIIVNNGQHSSYNTTKNWANN